MYIIIFNSICQCADGTMVKVFDLHFDLHFIRKRLKSNEYNIKKRNIKALILSIKKTANPYL